MNYRSRNSQSRGWFAKGVALLAVLGLLGTGSTARATLLTFAQFTQVTPSAQNFVYTNNTTSATFNTVSGGDPILLTVAPQVAPPGFATAQLAHLALLSSTTSPASNVGGNNLSESFPTLGNTLIITLDTPFMGHSNFLTVTFSANLDGLAGAQNSSSGTLRTSDASMPPDFVAYTSNIIDFTGTTEHSFALSFTSITPLLNLGTNNFYSSFTTSGTGTFDTNFPAVSGVPEPASVGTALLGVLGLAGAAWRRRRHRT